MNKRLMHREWARVGNWFETMGLGNGVYRLLYQGKVVYIGQGVISNRLNQHWRGAVAVTSMGGSTKKKIFDEAYYFLEDDKDTRLIWEYFYQVRYGLKEPATRNMAHSKWIRSIFKNYKNVTDMELFQAIQARRVIENRHTETQFKNRYRSYYGKEYEDSENP